MAAIIQQGTLRLSFQCGPSNSHSQISFATIVIGSMPYIFTKTSMLCFYLRLAPHPTFRILCYLSAAYIILSSSAATFVNLFGCSPISGGWDREPSLHSTCVTNSTFYYFSAVNNMATDVLLLGLPIPILVRLQLRTRVKFCLITMFSTGSL